MGIRKALEQEYDYEIVDEFLDHFDIMTDVMEPAIIAMEKPEAREEKIHELFRIFHNIKSAASFLKLERIALLAQLAEEVMEELRANPDIVSEAIIDWLLVVSDQMRLWYGQIASDEESLAETDPKILNMPE